MDQQDLVSGGVFVHEPSECPPTQFLSQTPIEFYHDAFIIGVTHPNVFQGHQEDDGWFLSDFYAFNYLMKNLGSEQTWLSVADPYKLVQGKRGNPTSYLFGNYQYQRKVVLSKAMLDKGQLTYPEIVPSASMADKFLQSVRDMSEQAKRNEAPLLLFVFCHGGENRTFYLDCGNVSRGLSMTRIKEAIEPGCRVTLISTAYYSGKWVMRDKGDATSAPMNITMLSASSEESTSWSMSPSFSRYCGSPFASAVVEVLASTTSPLILDSDRRQDEPETKIQPENLQPENPSRQQTETYNAFCRSIVEVCQSTPYTMAQKEAFTFAAQDDKWHYSWSRRTGIPPVHFRHRWDALETVEPTVHADHDLDTGGLTRNGSVPETFITDKTSESLFEQMTNAMAENRLRDMADIFRQTTPSDWNRGRNHGVYWRLKLLANGEDMPPYDDSDSDFDPEWRSYDFYWDMGDIIRHRWEIGLLVDEAVCRLQLPLPCGQRCIMWDLVVWRAATPRSLIGYASKIEDYLHRQRFPPEPSPSQGPQSNHAAHYLAAAIVEARLPTMEANIAVVDEFLEYYRARQSFYLSLHVHEHDSVKEKGRAWLESVGRRVSN